MNLLYEFGINLAIFRLSGKFPVCMLIFIIFNSVRLMTLVARLSIFGERPSSPVDFLISRDLKALTHSDDFITDI